MGVKKTTLEENIVRISSKGQFTLPAEIRKKMAIKKGDFLKTYTVGENLVVLEKPGKTAFERLTEKFAEIAKEERITPQKLASLVKKVRKDIYRELYGSKA